MRFVDNLIWRTLACSLLLVFAGAAAAHDEPGGSQEQKKAASKIKTPVTEASVEITAATPAELIRSMRNAANTARASGLEPEDMIRYYVFTVVKSADKLIAHPEAKDNEKSDARRAKLQALRQGLQFDEATFKNRFNEFVDAVLKDFPKAPEAAFAAALRLSIEVLSKPALPANAEAEVLKFAEQHPESPFGVELFAMLGSRLEDAQQRDRALAVYRKGVELFGKARNIDMLKDPLFKLELIGKPLQISGKTLNGSTIDIASMKGKVILVDFWATWCGPCVAEIPGVKRVYEKYHDKGFEVVAISLDAEKEPLEKFVKEQNLPWAQITPGDDLATKYKVNAIPAMFLVGRDGNVVSTTIRGEEAIETAVKAELAKPAAPAGN